MENKKFGYLLLGIAFLVGIIIYMFNRALHDIVNASCSLAGHGDSCPMTTTITQQTHLSLAIACLIVLIALYLIFTKPEKEVIIKTKTIQKRTLFNLSMILSFHWSKQIRYDL